MPDDLFKRIIEQASDSLADDVYRRILADRRAERGQTTLPGMVSPWEDIAARAVEEGILNDEEASRLVVRAQGRQLSGIRVRRRGSGGRGIRRAPDREDRGDDARRDATETPREGAGDDSQSG